MAHSPFNEHVLRSRTEVGCISHNVHIDCENPMRLTFFEQWANEETLRRHFAVPETRKFARLLRELAVPAANIPVRMPDRMPDRMDVYDATKARV